MLSYTSNKRAGDVREKIMISFVFGQKDIPCGQLNIYYIRPSLKLQSTGMQGSPIQILKRPNDNLYWYIGYMIQSKGHH